MIETRLVSRRRGVILPLSLRYPVPDFSISSHDVEGAPGEQAGDRIEIGCVNVTSHAGRFERDGASAAERIANRRALPEPASSGLNQLKCGVDPLDYSIADISLLGWVRNLIGFYGARELVGFDRFPHVQAWLNCGPRAAGGAARAASDGGLERVCLMLRGVIRERTRRLGFRAAGQ
jgi:hypothetical protein